MGRTLALLTRTLREDVRQVRMPLGWLLLLLLTLWMLVLAHLGSMAVAAPGLQLFMYMSFLNAVLITLLGVSHFATVITEEKEEMTLGLLKMAGVSPLALLLGKSTSRQLAAILALTVQFPFTLLAITLGGVLLRQIVTAYLALLAYTLLLSNVGLFFSVVCKRSGWVSTTLVLLLMGFYIGPSFCDSLLDELVRSGYLTRGGPARSAATAVVGWFHSASVFMQLTTIWSTGSSVSLFGFHFLSNVAVAALFFLLAWLTFDYFTRNETVPEPEALLLTFRKRRTSRRAWKRAVAWKDFNFVMGGPIVFAAKFLVYILLIGVIFYLNYIFGSYSTRPFPWKEFGWIAVGVAIWGLAIESALLAGRVFRHEVRWKTLPTIAMLPSSIPRLAYAKVSGCLISLIPGLFWLFVGCALDPGWIYEFVVDDFAPEPGGWYFVSLLILFWHLVAYLSLHVKWGAIPLGFVLVYFVGLLLMMTAMLTVQMMFGFGTNRFLGVSLEDLVFAGLALLMLASAAILHVRIGRRLQTLVSQ